MGYLLNHCSNSFDLNLVTWANEANRILGSLPTKEKLQYLTDKWLQVMDNFNREFHTHVYMESEKPLRREKRKTRTTVDFMDDDEVIKLSERFGIGNEEPNVTKLSNLMNYVLQSLFKKYQNDYQLVLNQD